MPPNDVLDQQLLEKLDPRTGHLLAHVLTMVNAGRSISGDLARHDTLHHAVNYALVRKRKVALSLAAAGAAAAVTAGSGTVAAAVALGGQTAHWLGSEGLQKVRMLLKAHRHAHSAIRPTHEQLLVGEDEQLFTAQVLDPKYRSQLFDDVRYLLEHQGLTGIFNAFDDFERDWAAIQASGLVQGVTVDQALANSGQKPTIRIDSCTDAIRLLENVARLRWRYDRLAGETELLEEFLTFTTLVISQFDADGVPAVKRLWKTILGPDTPATTADWAAMASKVWILLEKAARQIKPPIPSDAILSTLFEPSFGKDEQHCDYDPKDGYDAVITTLLQPALPRARELQKALRTLGQRILDRVIQLQWTEEVIELLMEEVYGMSAKLKVHPDKQLSPLWKTAFAGQFKAALCRQNAEEVTGILMDKGHDAVLGMLEDLANAAVGKATEKSLGTAALKSAVGFQKFSSTGDLISTAVLAVVGLAVEKGNTRWNESKFRSQQTLGLWGMRPQTSAERVGTLRTLAKEEIGEYADIMKRWTELYDEMAAGTDEPLQAAKLLLRFKACERAYYDNRCGYLLQDVVKMATKRLSWVAYDFFRLALEETDAYIRRRDPWPGDPWAAEPCHPYCYCRDHGLHVLDD